MKTLLIMATALASLFVAANSYACGNKSESGSKASKAEATSPKAEMKTVDAPVQTPGVSATTAQGSTNAKVMTTETHNSCTYMKDMGEKANAESGCYASKTSQVGKAMNGCEDHESSSKASKAKSAQTGESKKSNGGMVSKDAAYDPVDVTSIDAK